MLSPFPLKKPHSFIPHSFIPSFFIDNLLCTSLYSKFWGDRKKTNRLPSGTFHLREERLTTKSEHKHAKSGVLPGVLHTFGPSIPDGLFGDDRVAPPWGPVNGGAADPPKELSEARVGFPVGVGEEVALLTGQHQATHSGPSPHPSPCLPSCVPAALPEPGILQPAPALRVPFWLPRSPLRGGHS